MAMQLHRDQEVGVISGELEKEGFYGTEIQLFGFVYRDTENKVFVSEDELKTAVMVYNHYLQDYAVSTIFSESQRIYGDEEVVQGEKKKFLTHLKETLLNAVNEKKMVARNEPEKAFELLHIDNVAHCFSGFVFVEDKQIKSLVNAYFPQTIKWWLEKKLAHYEVSEVVIKERCSEESPAIQMKRLKDELLHLNKK
ncbi:MAG: hypothetical protein UDB11_05365 [Peptococcaceae bacterium]|nr:hypothetical protein [Peptococcaceae bacterium]